MAEQNNSSSSIMTIVIAVAVLLVVAIVPFSMKGKGSAAQVANSDEADARIQPVARVELKKAAAAASGPRDGASIYGAVCQACHASGAAGAPKTGDKAAWAPRIAQGLPTLLKNATNGKGAMPPKGGAADLSDSELKAVVEHIVKLSK